MPHDDSTRVSLLQKLANPRDQQAWADFVARYEPMIRGWCKRRGLKGEEVDDLTGEVSLKIVRAFKTFQYDPSKGFRAWLRTIVNNALRDFFKQMKRRRDHGDLGKGDTTNLKLLEQVPDDLAESLVDQLEHDSSKLVDEVLAEAEKRVSAQDWQIWRASQVEGRSDQTIGATMGKTRGAIHTAKWRVNQEIKRIVEQKNRE